MRPHLVRLCLLSVLAVGAAYQIRVPSEIRLGSFLSSAPFVEEFHDVEEGYRWTRTRSCLTFPDPGPRGRGTVALELSGFRPRGEEPPVAIVEVGDRSQRIATPRRFETVSLPVSLEGTLTTDVEVCIRSETFTPGPMDPRSLGVRIARARVLPAERGIPPLGQVVFGMVLAASLFSTWTLARGNAREGSIATAVALLALGAAYVVARPYAALLSGPLALVFVLLFCWARFLPASFRLALELASASRLALFRGAREVASARGLALALLSIAAVTLAFLARPRLEIDLGSGLDAPLLHRFGPADGESGVKFRRALSGASVDLGDFGGGTTWRLSVTAALEEGAASAATAILRAGAEDAPAELDRSWKTSTILAPSPFAWRAGLALELPSASPSLPLLVDRIELDRGRSLPSPRMVALVGTAALALLAAAGAAGLSPLGSFALASAILLLESIGIFLDPVGFVPSADEHLLIALLALGLAAIGGGFLRVSKYREEDRERASGVLLVSILGFVLWMTAMSYPLYTGLHFVYHSNIAEEIWKGKFLVFYLPHPDNILSREAQWGGLVVPYPCLYHTIVAPLTALPPAWFPFAHKLLQALLLAVSSLVASVLAWRFSGSGAAIAAGIVAVALVPAFQLLGLAHFLTVFGCAMASLALGFLALYLERLGERRIFWTSVALTSLAFLSYTASLLFTAVALALALPLVHRADRSLGRRLASSTLAAVAIAFFAYYVHWVLPFLRESVPILLGDDGGAGGSFPLFSRLAAIPRKLDYSFGSVLLPLAGLAGAGLAARHGPLGRLLLLSWASIVVVFSGLDLYFNFILKHHYFVMTPVAAGAGILAAELARSGRRFGRLGAFALVAFAVVLGLRAALALATGTIQ